MLNAIGDCLSDLASQDNEADAEDENDDEEDSRLGKPSEDHEPGCVMGTIYTMLQQPMESLQQKEMMLHK